MPNPPSAAPYPIIFRATVRRVGRTLRLVAPALAMASCAERGAPSLILFGAYFPGWMACAVIGVLGAIAARQVMAAVGLTQVVPHQLFVCAAVGLIVALAAWLLWFGR